MSIYCQIKKIIPVQGYAVLMGEAFSNEAECAMVEALGEEVAWRGDCKQI
jgi:hypothetical protein